jgi:tRNA 2-selenouridine synthase
MVHKISLEDFISIQQEGIVIDVRSPGEFEHAHIPGAYSLPLFNNEERAKVGTTYKQQSREAAIKIGLPMFGHKMLPMVEQVERWANDFEQKNNKKPKFFVHCWRGGMRSAAVAWLLDLYGFAVYQIIGGYKSFRNFIITQFDKPYSLRVLGGYTGSGKTEILLHLQNEWCNQPHETYAVIDLEGLAHHKGSAFGHLGQEKQPSQEMFENLLGLELFNNKDKTILIEDESQRIGLVMLPSIFFQYLRKQDCYYIKIPFESRLDFIIKGYGAFDKTELIAAISRIQKRLGGLETKNAIEAVEQNDIGTAFGILLKYYDKWYEKERKIIYFESERVDPELNAGLFINTCNI